MIQKPEDQGPDQLNKVLFNSSFININKNSGSKLNKINKYNFKNYYVNRTIKLKGEEITNSVSKYFDIKDFKVKKIIKPLYQYDRLSINKNLDIKDVKTKLAEIAKELKAEIKPQSGKRRIDLEKLEIKEINKLKVLTLNINGIQGKYHELLMLIGRHKIDILCLQETNRREGSKPLHINGFIIHESTSNETGKGLLIGIRSDLNLKYNITKSESNIILMSIEGKLNIGNVYLSHDSTINKDTCLKIAEVLINSEKTHKTLLAGDWNAIPARTINKLGRLGASTFAPDAPKKRYQVKIKW